MSDLRFTTTNIQFCGRNSEIKKAQQILHKIKSEFPASSSYIADLLTQKQRMKSENPDIFISLADMIDNYNKTAYVGNKRSNRSLSKLRRFQEYYLDNDYQYCNSLLRGIREFRVMNDKENSELAYLMAKINGYEDCYCINLSRRYPCSVFVDLDHTVLLLNQKLPPKIKKLDKFSPQRVNKISAFTPSRKSIVVDPLFGIVDYWENAVRHYMTIFPQISDAKDICAAARNTIINSAKDIKKIKYLYPECIIGPQQEKKEPNIFARIINYIREKI